MITEKLIPYYSLHTVFYTIAYYEPVVDMLENEIKNYLKFKKGLI